MGHNFYGKLDSLGMSIVSRGQRHAKEDTDFYIYSSSNTDPDGGVSTFAHPSQFTGEAIATSRTASASQSIMAIYPDEATPALLICLDEGLPPEKV